ncbi:unnamed protein product, partial [Anisakis simplex]|uniref:Uncharacterized protein n=1 Tax=Anisakis simplex TaxID=6269 RepID=A0A0M3JL02_ANISI
MMNHCKFIFIVLIELIEIEKTLIVYQENGENELTSLPSTDNEELNDEKASEQAEEEFMRRAGLISQGSLEEKVS